VLKRGDAGDEHDVGTHPNDITVDYAPSNLAATVTSGPIFAMR
jgi:hypothetical protein